MLKGIHYKNRFVYSFLTYLKLWKENTHRFKLAAAYVYPGEEVLDVCAGPGYLKKFLPEGCLYRCVEASKEFADSLRKRNIPVEQADLHAGLKTRLEGADVVVMVISLCQFKETSAHQLLEDFKSVASRVIIVEDVKKERTRGSCIQKGMNYLCAREYFKPMELYSPEEFEAICKQHGYEIRKHSRRYFAAFYQNNPKGDTCG